MKSIEIQLKKFGQVFSSRPEGREVALSVIAYHFNKDSFDRVTLDFEGVLIMTPSWLSEFTQNIKHYGIGKIDYKNEDNASVRSSIEMVEEEFRLSGT